MFVDDTADVGFFVGFSLGDGVHEGFGDLLDCAVAVLSPFFLQFVVDEDVVVA